MFSDGMVECSDKQNTKTKQRQWQQYQAQL
jgi:hypothetical protein